LLDECQTVGIPAWAAPQLPDKGSGTMVADTGKTLRADTTKPINLPETVTVEENAGRFAGCRQNKTASEHHRHRRLLAD